MRLMPKRVKFRKTHRGKIKGNATRGNTVCFGDYGLQSTEKGWITAQHLEAGRVAATQYISKDGKLFIRVFPHKPVSAKPIETRMGKGKGDIDKWVAVVKPGTILFELGGVTEEMAKSAFNRIAYKMPVRVVFVKRRVAI